MSTPMIAFHGGKCCGIKIIHSIGSNPAEKAHELKKVHGGACLQEADQDGDEVNSEFNFFVAEAPEESYKKRIERYLKYLEVLRPHGVIEITVSDDWFAKNQERIWRPYLTKWGFNLVTSCYNSNSGARIFIYHKTLDYEGE